MSSLQKQHIRSTQLIGHITLVLLKGNALRAYEYWIHLHRSLSHTMTKLTLIFAILAPTPSTIDICGFVMMLTSTTVLGSTTFLPESALTLVLAMAGIDSTTML
ncbi:uncharacterized protein BT62DRAFT_1011332 [Guyanagaster necrorhizus]|uniref:Uncharacterized protein n=1 Tax=Guyanagaster necrorhizus TaxID=856835 RepID=A0A9P8APD7_9AGAR|nr:uncharacterized protein BT62DRAFT_1011332 [Guyanagaster necrorhizus MCA 3950]KAG7441757.1 hypothetical protein BT62DRAFT_1011332 [Guyanagaster necrorhizus MCA 3950]